MEAINTSRMAVYVAVVGLVISSLSLVTIGHHIQKVNKRGRWLRGRAAMDQRGLAHVKFPCKSFHRKDHISVVASAREGYVTVIECDHTGFTAHSSTPALHFSWIAVGSK